MNKKWVVLLGAVLLVLSSQAYAVQTQKTLINAETISKSSPAVEEDSYVGDAEKVTFFITYDSSRETRAVSARVTAAVSIDGINWQDVSWFDVAGGVTPQTSETLSLDGTYVMWFDKALTAPYVRIRVNLSDATILSYGTGETADVTVTVIERK